MYKRKRAGNTITRKINSTKDTAAKADKNHYISNSYLEGFIPIDTEYFTASFDIHGMKQWPVILFAIGIIAVTISFILEGKTMPICTAFSYIAGFVVGVIFQTDGTDAGGATTNNLWIIWTVVFICLTLSGTIYDKFLSPSKKTIR